ncbi:MAG TPA: ABC transporter ATP-binding protein [Solirubrobacterales bacterium]|nr:ABC transporter ATP-binding protein [Solirubrobacterales bacterium]
MGDVAIETHELGKSYTLGVKGPGYGTLREAIVEAAQRPFRREGRGGRPKGDLLWALEDLSLTVRSGEVVGLIGHNGAGKSTLLKILSRITEPSAGYADVTGRVGSLLEVGTGFHPELTGRENIFLNGAILGMRRAEIRARFDEIVEFAEMERFLDTPVKRYSSGMSVRLAFAVAAHLEPEILLVDEVLAVGDASFQRKSLGKMNEVAKEGRTVIFVSHNLAIIQALCTRGILLERGRVKADAPIVEAIDSYLRTLERAASDDLLERTDRDSRAYDETLVRRLEIQDAGGGHPNVLVTGRPATIAVEVTEHLPKMECQLTVVNSLGQAICTFDSEMSAPVDVRDSEPGTRLECHVESLPLLPGRYRIDVLVKAKRHIQDGLQAAAFFDVEPGTVGERPVAAEAEGDVVLPHSWRLPA